MQRHGPKTKASKRPVIEAAKLDHPGNCGLTFTYYVIKTRDASDLRQAGRRRTRLRSGKILDPCNAVLIDCLIHDRSETGARIRLIGDVLVPHSVRLYEDWPENLLEAHVVWRKGREIGLRFNLSAGPRKITRSQLAHLRGHWVTP